MLTDEPICSVSVSPLLSFYHVPCVYPVAERIYIIYVVYTGKTLTTSI